MINNFSSISLSLVSLVLAAIFANFGYLIDPEVGALLHNFYGQEDLSSISIKFYGIMGGCLASFALALISILEKYKVVTLNIALSVLLVASAYGLFLLNTSFYAIA